MTNVKFNVPYAFHPGEYIQRALVAEQITQADFAKVIGISRFELNMIIKGKRNLKPRLANRIGEAFGTGPDVRLNLQTMYDLRLVKQNKKESQELPFISKRRLIFTPQLAERLTQTV